MQSKNRIKTLKASYRRGNVFIIFIGLFSILCVLVFAFSQRLSVHKWTIRHTNARLITRYFLEAYAKDVWWQVTKAANDPNSEVYKSFRNNLKDGVLTAFNYKMSDSVTSIKEKSLITINTKPLVEVIDVKPLEYPDFFNTKYKEMSAKLRIVVEAAYNEGDQIEKGDKIYSLEAENSFNVVLRLVPVLKDFVLFVDRMDYEQKEKLGEADNINVLFTKEGDHPLSVPSGFGNYARQRPWIVSAPLDESAGDENKTGRVFLGSSDNEIYLNLAGETSGIGQGSNQSEMFQIGPELFSLTDTMRDFGYRDMFKKRGNNENVVLKGCDVPLEMRGHNVRIGLLGFCHEVFDNQEGIFGQCARQLKDFLVGDPSFDRLSQVRTRLALSSGLKLLGNKITADPKFRGPKREIYGNVYARFMFLSFFTFPSAIGGGQVLPYNSNSNFQPPEHFKTSGISKVRFRPLSAKGKYWHYMSRIVSGGYDNDSLKDFYIPYSPYPYIKEGNSGMLKRKKLNYSDFNPPDGIKLSAGLNKIRKTYLAFNKNENSKELSKNIRTRIAKFFKDQAEFKKYVKYEQKRFELNAVVYVDGPLDLSEGITFPDSDITGGIVFVNGPIKLGNVSRGVNFFPETLSKDNMKQMWEYTKALPQKKIITFINVSNQPISLLGSKYLGIQLISLRQDTNSVVDHICWTNNPKDAVFCGGIAVTTLNLQNRLKEFGSAQTSLPGAMFFFVPSMSSENPDYLTQIKFRKSKYFFSSRKNS